MGEVIPPDANVILSIFLLYMNSIDDAKFEFTVSYFVGGQRDKRRDSMLCASQKLNPS